MNWDALGAIGELIGAVAVLLTLIYLAIQSRQNNELVKFHVLQKGTTLNGPVPIQAALSLIAIFTSKRSTEKRDKAKARTDEECL